MEEQYKCIISPKLARHLIKSGYIIKDIRPNREIKNATIFLFYKDINIEKEIELFKKTIS